MKDILLVTMPWNSLDMPSIQLGILRAVVQDKFPEQSCDTVYANLLWADYLYKRSGGTVTRTNDYPMIAEQTFGFGVGEWVFTPALYDNPQNRENYVNFLKSTNLLTQDEIAVVEWMYEQSKDFINWLVDNIITEPYKIVGFTSTFMQNIPSLALAKVIKERYPSTKIVFGGGNCDGDQGAALHRNFPFVDFVIRGEGEDAFPKLIQQVIYETDPRYDKISGLCFWKEGRSVANPMLPSPIDFQSVPFPYYDDYFKVIEDLDMNEYIHPQLTLETSRGCWWGAKHQCTFCGLNGSFMTYRSKPADYAFEKITEYVKKYKTLDLFMIDNIMDISYLKELLPRIKELGWDLNIFYEVKANLLEDHVRLLSEAGVKRIQPGVESLSTRVLKIMKKGVTALQNIQLLKWCEQYNVEVSWNILYGFPGETSADYDLEKMRLLSHLQPPDIAVRINLVRFSPYFENPELGIKKIEPAKFYSHVYQLPEEELMDLAYIFESEPVGLTEEEAEPIRQYINYWQDIYADVTFNYRQGPDGSLHFYDTRPIAKMQTFKMNDPLHVMAHQELNSAKSVEGLRRRLKELTKDRRLASGSDYLERWCKEMESMGVLYEDNGKYLALAIPYDPQRLRYRKFVRAEEV
ncbi:RiPP maturation radical SAM C-methyltransferase [Brevibacillus thermoruber]|uniref:RiPP maturation radical SAM C-methyltransferase n=1 Tax=Brevibacillus thermoruber TaxID=33942 RepID=A0A9X3TUN2_9BACL|nr:RiPP maturation radical SAM C-methyltransferase [Brevibacillus thermoruber]MDA5110715.1 RiPP maturation radical SAM C-methyltransferase [Brevibacillus thermoruber]